MRLDVNSLHDDPDNMKKSGVRWHMELNTNKSGIINFGRERPHDRYTTGNVSLQESTGERDLVVMFNSDLCSRKQWNEVRNCANWY